MLMLASKFQFFGLEKALLISAAITTVCATVALPNRYGHKNTLILLLYNFFLTLTYLLVTTKSIVTFFYIYELFLLPSALLVWLFSPNKRGQRVSVFFLVWTQFGSFLVLVGLYLLVVQTKINNFLEIEEATQCLPKTIPYLIFFGFLIKIPTVPFYF